MKILLIRFSSIGDILLTTPVIRCLKKIYPDAEIHFLTKPAYQDLLRDHPDLTEILLLDDKMKNVLKIVRKGQYDHIIDLHKNLRTWSMQIRLFRRFRSFSKLNIRKWLRVNLKWDVLPRVHIVDRYLKAVAFLGVENDKEGLDFFIEANCSLPQDVATLIGKSGYNVIVIGAKQFTKQIPSEKIQELCLRIPGKIILLGGFEDQAKGEAILNLVEREGIINACGLLTLQQSAFLLSGANQVITSDTGMMHLAAALKKNIISIWGNTIPEFGMFPYMPDSAQGLSHIIEPEHLKCRPCSKLGKKSCPKKHFKCMNDLDVNRILEIMDASSS